MNQMISTINFDTDLMEVVRQLRLVSTVLKNINDEELVHKIYKHIEICGVIYLKELAVQLTVEILESKFKNKNGDELQVIFKHKSDRTLLQKRIFSVQEKLQHEYPSLKIFIDDPNNDFNYVIYVKNKKVFNSIKFKELCNSIKKWYLAEYGRINYRVELKD